MPIYKCDPSKNTSCAKTSCFINGGGCECTTHKAFSKDEEVVTKLIKEEVRKETKMKKLLSLFSKEKNYATGGVVPKPIIGITAAEYTNLRVALQTAYAAACDRQKSCDSKPSGYMKGLKEAMNIIDSVKPHTLAGGV